MTKKYILGALNICTLLLASILLIIGFISIKLTSTFKIILLSLFLLIISIVSINFYFTKDPKKYNVSAFIIFTINIILLFEIINLNNKYSFISEIINNNYNYPTYNIYAKKSTTIYSNISKLNDKKIGILKNDKTNIKKILNIDVEYLEYDNLESLLSGINNGEVQGIALNSELSNQLESEKNGDKVRIIYNTIVKENK